MSAQTVRTRDLLRQAITSSIPPEPSQYDQVQPQFVYVPGSHLRALDPNAMLVEGIRGAGKSFWWFALQSDTLRPHLVDQPARDSRALVVSAGFGQGTRPEWPEKDELEQLLAEGIKPRLIWKMVVLRHVAPDALPGGTWAEAARWVSQNPPRVAVAMREADTRLQGLGKQHLVLFDALDRTADLRLTRMQLLRGLLELVLELRAYSSIRAKVFVRPDMLEDPEVKAFPDASKVLASRVPLDWSGVDLYALLFTYLGNGDDDEAAACFRGLSRLTWRRMEGRYVLPVELRTDWRRQEQVFTQLAGPYMGTDRRRGKTYSWVLNHLADAREKVSPRSFLAAIRRAAEGHEVPNQLHPLHWSGLHEGVRKASEYRVTEISEDLDWAHDAMSLLKGLTVPCPASTLLREWKKGKLIPPLAREANRPATQNDLEEMLDQLANAGVLEKLGDGRINIPDVYRVGFGMRRLGGFRPS
ncbi:MAG: hypothetical protein U1A78_02510 [Polyangia bacterium]